MQRLRPDDQFMLLMDSEVTPMQIGALIILDVPPAERPAVFEKLRSHFLGRLPRTPLLRVLRHCPALYDSPVWLNAPPSDAESHIVRGPGGDSMDDRALRAFAARFSVERLDLSRPPFLIAILDNLAGGGAAVLIKVHHALTDGVGFQTILGLLSDEADASPESSGAARRERSPAAPLWLAWSALRLARARPARLRAAKHRAEAAAALKQFQVVHPRTPTPVLKLSGPISAQRAYATISLDLDRLRAMARALCGTINDMFLAIAAGAVRAYLQEIGDLPDMPLVANSARSIRRPEHGAFGNRIVALHPALATHLADPLERLRAIQAAMALEKRRTHLDEALLDQPETPFGPRDRRRKFAQRPRGEAVLPGNITLSNVPGPAGPRFFAGLRQTANFPTPLLGSGRFLNITARRNGDRLDLGIMTDPARIGDIGRLVTLLHASFGEYAALGAGQAGLVEAGHGA